MPSRSPEQQPRRIGPIGRPRPRWQRLSFTIALVTLAFASFFSASNLLSRAWPAIFPGEQFNFIIPVAHPVLDNIPLTSYNEDSAFNRRRNFLILGLDNRPGDENLVDHNTDVIIVASIDPVTKRANLLSFPRDLYIDIHLADGTVYQNRINSSFGAGVMYGDGTYEAGAEQLMRDMYENFGVSIDNWVIFNFRGVQTVVDALGGVDAEIPEDLAVYDWYYSDDDLNPRTISIPAGMQHLDGYHAVAFGRHRDEDTGDFGRIKRQQVIISALAEKMSALNLLSNPLEVWNAYKDTVHTDIASAHVPGLGNLFRQTQENVRTYSLADPVNGVDSVTGFTTETGAQVLDWNRENVQYWVDLALSGSQTYAESDVEIRNGIGEGGLAEAQALADYLHNQGLPTVYIGPDETWHDYTQVIIYDESARLAAEDIVDWLGLSFDAIVTETSGGPASPAVAIVVGADYSLPPD